MDSTQAIWLLAAVVVFDLFFVAGVLLWFRRRIAALTEDIASSLGSHERILAGPQRATYPGLSRRFGFSKADGVLALTDRRLLFGRVIGKPIELDTADIESTNESRWSLSAWATGRGPVAVHLKDGGGVTFWVRDARAWVEAIERAARNR